MLKQNYSKECRYYDKKVFFFTILLRCCLQPSNLRIGVIYFIYSRKQDLCEYHHDLKFNLKILYER